MMIQSWKTLMRMRMGVLRFSVRGLAGFRSGVLMWRREGAGEMVGVTGWIEQSRM